MALEKLESDGPGALEELYRRHPDSADALRLRIEWLVEAGLVSSAAPAREYPERLGDFRLIEPVGQGGMGVVYRAEQLSLGREVALKLVRPEQLYFPGALQRFEREVATIAALSHPGIVPIYAVGQEQGVPFFAMEHVIGVSLGEVIAHLQGRAPQKLQGSDLVTAIDALAPRGATRPGAEPDSTLFSGPWPTVCARIVREVAEALEHAHRRGVLHRDVKPSNVMVTRGGRVMLVDFGLSSHAGVGERATRTGHRVGTLAYMAPEQLRAETRLSTRVDVYSTGVMLYELLTLRLPHDTASAAERLAAGRQPLPGDLRKVDPRVPWELETVAQTAADPDPERRYASAADLAADLGNVLASRPIAARRSSLVLRARRWIQRNPVLALTALVVTVGPSVLAVQEQRSNRALTAKGRALAAKGLELAGSNAALARALEESRRQRDEAERLRAEAESERARSERNFERAYQAVELMLGRVGGEVLAGVPRMEPIRRALLQDALALQEELLQDATDGSQPRLLARTLRRAARLRADLGEYDAALETLDREAEVLDGLLAQEAEEASKGLRIQRGELDRLRAGIHKRVGRLEQAETWARGAVASMDRLRDEQPGADAEWAAGGARLELADVLIRAGRAREARDELARGVGTLQMVVDEHGGDWEERNLLAHGLHLLSGYPTTHLVGGDTPYDPRVGEPYLRRALELRRALAAERPDDPRGRQGLLETALALGNTLGSAGRFAEAEPFLEQAVTEGEELVASFPSQPANVEALAAARYDLSLLAAAGGRPDQRRELLEAALDGWEGLHTETPELARHRQRLAFAEAQLGHALREEGLLEEAERHLLRALELGTPILTDAPADYDLRMALVWATTILCSARLELGDLAGTVEAAQGYLGLHPLPVEQVYVAYWTARAVGRGRERSLPEERLAAWTERALDLLEQAAGNAPRDPDLRREIVDPDFAPFAEDERYLGLLGLLGLQPPAR